MAKKAHIENTVGPWAAEKLRALREYLHFYTTALKKSGYWEKIYIDAFAGAGISKIRSSAVSDINLATLFELDDADVDEAEQYLKGSPNVALELDTPFDRYIFIERDPTRAKELEALALANNSAAKVEIRQEDASTALFDISQSISKSRHRAVAFIDPYGLNISWEAVQALGKTGAVEVIINFAWAMAINRLMVKEGNIPANWSLMLDGFFGDHEWYDLAYKKEADLFGEQTSKVPTAEKNVLQYYLKKLERCFGHVGPPMLVRNTKGNPLYYLIWAGPHPLGLKGAKHVLSQGETVSLS